MEQVYIYGAQAVAYSCLLGLRQQGIDVTAFVVTNSQDNPEVIDNLPVLALADVPPSDALFYVGTPAHLHGEIVALLEARGFTRHILLNGQQEFDLEKDAFRQYGFPCLADYQLSASPSGGGGPLAVEGVSAIVYIACSARDRKLKQKHTLPFYHVPIQAGAALDPPLPGLTLRDNTGENISGENRLYSELTVTYWAWRNSPAAYKGIAHYRRHLLPTEDDWALLLTGQVDAIMPLPFACWPDTSAQYGRYSHPDAIAALLAVLDEAGLGAWAREQLAGHFLYNYNMLIARAEVFDDYCAWMFPLLAVATKRLQPLLASAHPPKRPIGYLGEILTSLYFLRHKDDLRLLHVARNWLT